MTTDRNKTQRWFRLRLRTLFLVVTLAAMGMAWIWPKLGLSIVRIPHRGSSLVIFWGGQRWFLYDSVRERERKRLEQTLEKQRLKALARFKKEAAAREQELQLDIMEANRLLEGPVEK